MTIGEQLKLVRDSLQEWARGQGGTAGISRDLVDLFGALRTKPGAVRVYVLFRTEVKRGEFEEAGMVDRFFWVVVSKGRGMKLEPADDLVEESASGPAMYDLLEEARQEVRNLEFDDTTEKHVDFREMKPLEINGYLLDGHYIEFSIGCQLDAPGGAEDETTG